jgi:hypothetical protein
MAKSTAQDLAGARGHFVTAGTPEQIADLIEDLARRWVQRDAPILPGQFDVFAGEVGPILQRRGLFRTEYTGSMLRDHYGLPCLPVCSTTQFGSVSRSPQRQVCERLFHEQSDPAKKDQTAHEPAEFRGIDASDHPVPQP